MNETRNEPNPKRNTPQHEPALIWDRLTAADRHAYAAALNARLTELRATVRTTQTETTEAIRQLRTTRARADIAYRHLMQLQKANARLTLKNNRLREEIANRQRRLAKLPDASPQLAEATAESFPDKRQTHAPH